MSLENIRMAFESHDPVALALAEDLGREGDVTCQFFVDPAKRGLARIVARQACTLAGMEAVASAFRHVDADTAFSPLKPDGAAVVPFDVIAIAQGRIVSLLIAERVALNFVQRLSGVATLTRKFVEAIQGTKARILDTRKTTPCLRRLEKLAVKAGGGVNHRSGLYDMVLIKDNHLAGNASPSDLQRGIDRARAERPGVKIEVEADTLEQVQMFLSLSGIDVILLDNMTPAQLREAVAAGAGRVKFEASGGITLETVRSVAETGVDFISVGALTHSAPSIDFSMELIRDE